MENPVYKLEKVLYSRSEEEMQDFEGPLDLILFLLGKNRMEIQDISISTICDQYLDWLKNRQEMDLEVASEFVTMSSHLLYLKTRMLLSIEDEEAQQEMDALIESLEERRRSEQYEQVRRLSAALEIREPFGRNILTRPPEVAEQAQIYQYQQKPEDLIRAMSRLFRRSQRLRPPSEAPFREIVQHEPYPVETKAQEILRRFRTKGVLTFRMLFRGNRSRSEVVATFLAVLELCRARLLTYSGEGGEEVVYRQPEEGPEK